jgi:hypothetical protein
MLAKTTNRPISKSLHDEDGRDESSFKQLLHSIKGIAEGLNALNRQAVREYEPIIEALDAHNTMSTKALNSETVKRGIKDILLNHSNLWETLRVRAAG